MSLYSERIRLRDAFLTVLAQCPRDNWELVSTSDGDELGWVVETWFAMSDEIERRRVLLGRPPVLLQAVQDADRMASGHIDYAEKFSLYCAELVLT